MAKKQIIVTGFGTFSGVDDNPTAAMVKHLSGLPECADLEFHILQVSVDYCDQYLLQLLSKWQSNAPSVVYFIHMGVDSNATSIKLEQCAYNNMNFRVPDVADFQPAMQPILSKPLDEPCRTYPLHGVLSAMAEHNPLVPAHVTLSEDPGRYLCNYIFYRTLTLCEQPYESLFHGRQEAAGAGTAVRSLFVHVPPFTVLAMEHQLSIIMSLLQVIRGMEEEC